MSLIYHGGEVKKYDQGKYTFAIQQMPPFHAMKVLGEIQKIIVPALGGAASGFKEEDEGLDVRDPKFIGGTLLNALDGLADRLTGEQLERAAVLLLDPQYVSVAPLHTKDFQELDEMAVNEVFSGRILDMVVLMVQVFKVNYLDFTKLSSVPTGVRTALGEAKKLFRESARKNSKG